MIRIINNEIHIPRGDSAILQFDILNKNGEPYILPKGMINPTLIFAVAAKTESLKLSNDLLIAKYYPILNYQENYQFESSILPDSQDSAQKYQVFRHTERVNGTNVRSYYYYDNDGEKREYRFVVTVNFTIDDTNRLTNSSYRYCIILADTEDETPWLYEEPEFEGSDEPVVIEQETTDDMIAIDYNTGTDNIGPHFANSDQGFTFINKRLENLEHHINLIFWKDTIVEVNNFIVEDSSYAFN